MKQKIKFLLATIMMLVGMTAQAATTVTWNNSDISSYGRSVTKDGVTMNVTGDLCDFFEKNFTAGTFTSTVGNFTKIEVVTAGDFWGTMGSGWTIGWTENQEQRVATWTGTASSTVSFGGSGPMDGIWGMGQGVTIVFTIEPTTVNVTGITLSQTEAAMTVGGGTLTLTPTVLPANATDKSVTWTSSNAAVATVNANGVVTAVAAGTATITATANDGSGKKGTCTVTVKKNLQASWVEDIADQTYTGGAIEPAVTVKDGETTLREGTDYTVAYTNNTVAGTATATVTAVAGSNYSGVVTKTFAIKKADITMTTAPAAVSGLVYSGEAQTLITVGVASFGAVVYSLDGTNFSEALPQATEAGTYFVIYKVQGDNNHNDLAAQSLEGIVISTKPLEDAWIQTIADQTYTGEAIEPTVTVQNGATTLTEGTDYTVAYADNTAAGTATVTVTPVAGSNYNGSATNTFTIAKANITMTTAPAAVDGNLIYSGEAQTLITAGAASFGTVLYSLDGTNFSDALPQATEADTYTVTYKVEGDDNHNAFDAQTLDVIIYQHLDVDELAAEVFAAPGENVAMTANITSGVAPFTVIWTDAQGQPIGETITATEPGEYGYSVLVESDSAYSVSVTDSLGQQFTADVQLTVAGRGLVADFENLPLERESYWNGSDGKGQFVSGGYRFENGYYENAYGSYSYGFAYSNMTASTFATYAEDRYNSCVGGGVDGSETFAVYSMVKGYKKGVQVFGVAEGDSVTGFYVTNTASAYKAMSEGSDLARKFAAGDWFKLTVTGIDCNGQETGTVEYYLADFRDPQQSYIISDWRWVDLSTLGLVKRLEFSLSSSDNGAWSMNTPAYFCMDNLGGEKPEYEEPIITSISTVAPQLDVVPVGVYSVSGAPQQGLQPGVNIVKYSDGSTKKILVK